MSTLTLVRHGQAAAFTADSDRLTELGEEQARRLAAYWIANGVSFDQVVCGELVRQHETARIVQEAYRAAGRKFPEMERSRDFNEYDAGAILRFLAPALVRETASFADLWGQWEASAGLPDRNRAFQLMFEALMAQWIAGTVSHPNAESWTEFRARVRRSLRAILEQPEGKRNVALFTSGGVIGLSVQTLMECPEPAALELNWRVRNTSLTAFLYSRGRVSLDWFNATPHLPAEMISFR
ncbi:MAG: histidine phosphatase family protein [Acidimicrobiia bacterium]|nr:histidine phosphatase family protein [Acidimicrobiia bacterium]